MREAMFVVAVVTAGLLVASLICFLFSYPSSGPRMVRKRPYIAGVVLCELAFVGVTVWVILLDSPRSLYVIPLMVAAGVIIGRSFVNSYKDFVRLEEERAKGKAALRPTHTIGHDITPSDADSTTR